MGMITIIHVVQPGETVTSIADQYGISRDWLILENGITDPDDIVAGDTFVILFPEITHTIVNGDTLEDIAAQYNVSVMEILRNNSHLGEQEYLNIGDTIVIKYEGSKKPPLTVNGYTYSFIDINILRKTLPYLTYLTIYSYRILQNGELVDIDDTEIIEITKAYGVAPIMLLTFFDEDRRSPSEIIHNILIDVNIQNRLIDNTIDALNTKGYYGLSFDYIYVYPYDRQRYLDFMTQLITRVRDEGFLVLSTIIPTSFELISESLIVYEYSEVINQMTDASVLFPNEVGMTLGAPVGSISMDLTRRIIEYALDFIPAEKLLFGISTIGYIWELPYEVGTSEGHAISNYSAVQYAKDYDQTIEYDQPTESAFFTLFQNSTEYVLRFKDARSIQAYLQLVDEYNLSGIGIWSVTTFFHDFWLLINSQYEIQKIPI
jgi:spore germination protein YaaH